MFQLFPGTYDGDLSFHCLNEGGGVSELRAAEWSKMGVGKALYVQHII